MGEWKTQVGDTVEIGQELGTILTEDASLEDQMEAAAKIRLSAAGAPAAAIRCARARACDTPDRHSAIEPALSPTITRKLGRVVPANLQIDARWDAIRKARDAAKKSNGKSGAFAFCHDRVGSR